MVVSSGGVRSVWFSVLLPVGWLAGLRLPLGGIRLRLKLATALSARYRASVSNACRVTLVVTWRSLVVAWWFQSDTYWFHSHSSFGAPGNQSKERNPANKVAKRICILFLGIWLTSIMSRGLEVAIGRFILILLSFLAPGPTSFKDSPTRTMVIA